MAQLLKLNSLNFSRCSLSNSLLKVTSNKFNTYATLNNNTSSEANTNPKNSFENPLPQHSENIEKSSNPGFSTVESDASPNSSDSFFEDKPTTHFGFKSVPEELKETLVGKVFSSVAGKYDVMNDCMSFGVHRLWKDHFIHTMAPGPGTKLLDVAGGTGDIALRFLEYCQKYHNDTTAHVRVVDINPNMLAHGAQRYQKTKFIQHNQAQFQVGNAENLKGIPDNSVDVYTISFGIRNCTHVDQVLKEAYRVLKSGGRFMCLEFSKVEAPVVKQLYDVYSFQIIPQIGSLVTNDRDSYQYLVESIRQFPDQKTFTQMIQSAGFVTLGDGYENLTFGVAAMHTGYKF